MAAPLLILQDIDLTFGGTPLLTGAALSVGAGERLCLVGRNGSGKSTLLKIAAGLVEPDHGEVVRQLGTTIRYLPQEPDFAAHRTALDYVAAGLAPGDDEYRAQALLNALGMIGDEELATLSGGGARRCALARVLAPAPDILLLDEPTNHLDLPAIEWLEDELAGMRSALVLISHDRRFLENLTRRTIWLDRGRTRTMDAGFAEFETWRDNLLEQEELERHKLDRKIAREEDWVVHGVSGRRKRNVRRLAQLGELRKQVREQRQLTGAVKLEAAQADTSAKLLMEATGISKTYGDKTVVREISLRVRRGDRLGLIGPNGAGKTTLLKLLTGQLAPDTGTVKIADNMKMVTLDQGRATLDPSTTLRDALTGGHGDLVDVGEGTRHVMSYLRDFLFAPEQARTPLGKLSGGERGRLMLARALALPSNLLVLDEPTNDLDLETLDLLQEMLADYAGTVLLVSHDRDFLDRVCTSVLGFEGDGQWQEYPGGYSDMVTQRGHGVQAAAAVKAERPRGPAPRSEAARAGKAKLSFKESHALKTLPARIEGYQAEIAALQAKLADPKLFAKDAAGFAAATKTLAKKEADLAAAEEEWLNLEMRREEVEG